MLFSQKINNKHRRRVESGKRTYKKNAKRFVLLLRPVYAGLGLGKFSKGKHATKNEIILFSAKVSKRGSR